MTVNDIWEPEAVELLLSREFKLAADVSKGPVPVYISSDPGKPGWLKSCRLVAQRYFLAGGGSANIRDGRIGMVCYPGGAPDTIQLCLDKMHSDRSLEPGDELRVLDLPQLSLGAFWVIKPDGKDVFVPYNLGASSLKCTFDADPDFLSFVEKRLEDKLEAYKAARARWPGDEPLGG